MRYLEWEKAQPDNWFTADQNLQRTLEFYAGAEAYRVHLPTFYQFGRTAATEIAILASGLFELSSYEEHEQIEKMMREAGLYAAHATDDNHLHALGLFYLSAQNGESGAHVKLAQTAALIKLLTKLQVNDGEFKVDEVLDQLLSTQSPGEVAHLLFDAGRAYGLMAGYQIMLDDTNTLVVIAVPPHDAELQDMIGFQEALVGNVEPQIERAFQIGKEGQGQIYWDDIIRPTLHIHTAVACAAHLRRAYLTAWSYAAKVREADTYLIHDAHLHVPLTEMRSDAVALASGSFHIAKLLDSDDSDPDLPAVIQTALALHAFRAPQLALDGIQQGISVLGANGLIESFSVLPRLLRDTMVYREWCGRPATIMRHLQRDCNQFAMHLPFLARVRAMFARLTVPEIKQAGSQACDQIGQELEAILKLPEDEAAVYFTPLMVRLADLFYVACLAVEGSWERVVKQDRTKQRLAEFMLKRRVTKLALGQWQEYPTWVGRLCHEGRPPRVDWQEDNWDGSDDPMWQ